jgi:nitrate/TMAO reductase-like tetraheme cytochrome c subunit
MRAFVAAALRSRLSALGIALTTASALIFVGLVLLEVLGALQNPYVGIITFVIVPALFVLGLLLIPIGLWLARRRGAGAAEAEAVAWPAFDLRNTTHRRMLGFVLVATIVNLAIIAMASVGAVEYTESQSFCGQVCHTPMDPQFTAHQSGPHARVHCVSCHVGPGAGGFLTAKMNGTRQLWLVATGGFSRPIPSPIHGMPSVTATCEQCHAPDRFVGDVVKPFYEHADDEANTQTKTVVTLKVGGALAGSGTGAGIHWHMNLANVIEYVALDDSREKIPYVRVTTPDGKVREYFAEGVTAETIAGKASRRMDCLDCHSRPAHTFETSAARAVDEALGRGAMSASIPFLRREAVRALAAEYPSRDAALAQIEQTMRAALPTPIDEAELRRAIGVTKAIYQRSVFPTMKVGWGTYKVQSGHTSSDGCFRCHDDEHKTRDGAAIRQDCEMCHTIE